MISTVDTTAGRAPATLGDIEKLAATLADHSTALDDQLAEYERELQAVNEKFLRPLKRLATATAQAEAELHAAIEGAPHLFVKPRTISVHGIKVGFVVSEGKLVWDDEESVVAQIKKWHPDDLDVLLHTTEKPNKDNLKINCDEKELKKLGCRIEDAGDQVLIKRTAGEIEKLINKLKAKLVEAIVEAA
jgi:hypothetical protein